MSPLQNSDARRNPLQVWVISFTGCIRESDEGVCYP